MNFRLMAVHVRTGRAVLNWSRKRLADEASKISKVSAETIKDWEERSGPINATADRIDAVVRTFDAAGVELLNHGQPGARLKAVAMANEGQGATDQ